MFSRVSVTLHPISSFTVSLLTPSPLIDLIVGSFLTPEWIVSSGELLVVLVV